MLPTKPPANQAGPGANRSLAQFETVRAACLVGSALRDAVLRWLVVAARLAPEARAGWQARRDTRMRDHRKVQPRRPVSRGRNCDPGVTLPGLRLAERPDRLVA